MQGIFLERAFGIFPGEVRRVGNADADADEDDGIGGTVNRIDRPAGDGDGAIVVFLEDAFLDELATPMTASCQPLRVKSPVDICGRMFRSLTSNPSPALPVIRPLGMRNLTRTKASSAKRDFGIDRPHLIVDHGGECRDNRVTAEPVLVDVEDGVAVEIGFGIQFGFGSQRRFDSDITSRTNPQRSGCRSPRYHRNSTPCWRRRAR